jgi:hypothetical protein
MRINCVDGKCPECQASAKMMKDAIDKFSNMTLEQRVAKLIEIGILDANGDLAPPYRNNE